MEEIIRQWLDIECCGTTFPPGFDSSRVNHLEGNLGIDLADLARRIVTACSKIASDFSMKPDRSIHPDIPWDEMSEVAKSVAHTTAQQIALAIRYLAEKPHRDDTANG